MRPRMKGMTHTVIGQMEKNHELVEEHILDQANRGLGTCSALNAYLMAMSPNPVCDV